MERSEKSGVPWGVALINNGYKQGIFFWGDGLEPQCLLGRPFVYGLYDCYTLVKDFYKVELGIELPIVVSEYGWESKGERLFEDLYESIGFSITSDSSYCKGDIFMWSIGSKVINHIGVYAGKGQILHHFNGRLSQYSELRYWASSARMVIRKND
jgi:cell wall-associated NlpC family hydrolase